MRHKIFPTLFLLLSLAFTLGPRIVLARAQAQPATSEADALLDRLDNRAPASEDASRSLGLLQYNVSGSAAKLLPDISVIGSFAGAYFSTDPVAGTTGHDPARTGFSLQEIEMALQSSIDPYLRGDLFLGFMEDGVELEEGYVTTLGLPKGLQIRAGKFLLPLGRQNPKHLELWAFADNTLVNKYLLGAESLRELGIEAAYVFPLPFYLQAQFSFTDGANDASFNGARKEDFLYQGRLAASVDLSPATTLLFGASGAWGYNDTGPGEGTLLAGGDFLLKWKPGARTSFTWQSEFLMRRMSIPGATNADGGFYSYVDYQFFKRWHAGLRYDHVGLPDDTVAKEFRVTPIVSFEPTEFSRVRLQYEFDKITGTAAAHAAILQLEFNMGPHGSHPF